MLLAVITLAAVPLGSRTAHADTGACVVPVIAGSAGSCSITAGLSGAVAFQTAFQGYFFPDPCPLGLSLSVTGPGLSYSALYNCPAGDVGNYARLFTNLQVGGVYTLSVSIGSDHNVMGEALIATDPAFDALEICGSFLPFGQRVTVTVLDEPVAVVERQPYSCVPSVTFP